MPSVVVSTHVWLLNTWNVAGFISFYWFVFKWTHVGSGGHIGQHSYRLCVWKALPAFLSQTRRRVSFRRAKHSGSSQYFYSSSGLRNEWSTTTLQTKQYFPPKVVQALLFIFHSKVLAEFRTQRVKGRLVSQDSQLGVEMMLWVPDSSGRSQPSWDLQPSLPDEKGERRTKRIRQNNTNNCFV